MYTSTNNSASDTDKFSFNHIMMASSSNQTPNEIPADTLPVILIGTAGTVTWRIQITMKWEGGVSGMRPF